MAPFVYVSCYNQFGNLAHQPTGKPAEFGIQKFDMDSNTGKLSWIGQDNSCPNPSFIRFHPKLPMFYTCSESITEEDRVYSYRINKAGQLEFVKEESLGGKSACFLTIDRSARHLLWVNYWDSTLGSLPLSPNGKPGKIKHFIRAEKKVVSRHRGDHLGNRQLESHCHAIVLDHSGKFAFVPDLGRDLVHQFIYDDQSGKFSPAGKFPSSNAQGPHGPRYLEFHPTLSRAYLVNELSSTVSVFEVMSDKIKDAQLGDEEPVFKLLQVISTIPEGFTGKNTCGRICVHPSSGFVFASNRGHDSLAVYRVRADGLLTSLGFPKTGGKTPRHFKFDPTGRFCIVANQDSDNICVFKFDRNSGQLDNVQKLDVPSPNFIGVTGEQPYSQFYPVQERSYTNQVEIREVAHRGVDSVNRMSPRRSLL